MLRWILRLFKRDAAGNLDLPDMTGNEPALSLTYEETKRVFDAGHDHIDKLDAKTGLLLGAAGIVLAVLFQGGFGQEGARRGTNVLLSLAAAAISGGGVCALIAMWPRTFAQVPDPLKVARYPITGGS